MNTTLEKKSNLDSLTDNQREKWQTGKSWMKMELQSHRKTLFEENKWKNCKINR